MSDSATLAAAEAAAAKPARKKWSLRIKILLGVAFFVVLSTVIAVAAVISSLSLGGSVANGEFVAVYEGATAAVVDPADNYKTIKDLSTPSVTDKKKLTLPPGTVAYFGEAIDLAVGVKPDPNHAGSKSKKAYVSGITMPSALPAGWNLSIVSGCGVVSGSAYAAPVKLRMEPSQEATTALSLEGMKVIVTALPDNTNLSPGSTVSGVTCDLKVG